MAVFFPMPTPAETARDLLVAAAWLRAAGYPADRMVRMAIELLGVPLPEEGSVELLHERGRFIG